MIDFAKIEQKNQRELAFYHFSKIINQDYQLKKHFEKIAKKTELSDNKEFDSTYYLTEKTLDKLIQIDEIIKSLLKKNSKDLPKNIFNILRLAICELTFGNNAIYAITNEWVNLSKKYGHQGTVKLTNAVLRNYLRNKEKIFNEFQKKSFSQKMSINYSLPIWLIEYWCKYYPETYIEKICIFMAKKASIYLRINTLKTSAEDLKEKFKKAKINFESNFVNESIKILEEKINIAEIPGYEEGLWYAQDLASMLVAKVVNPQKGDTIIEFCSFPGGKTSHISALMQNQGKIFALDVNEKRKKLFDENIKKLGCKNIEVIIQSATEPINIEGILADKILVDPPCSGLGVIRRKSEIKYRRNLENIEDLANLQRQILEKASSYLKVGGELIYSTCTFSYLENEMVIDNFLKKNKNYRLKKIELPGYDDNQGFINLDPEKDETDLFFISRLEKIS